MAILSDYEEAEKKPAPSAKKQFSASLDPSNPLGFLENVLEFIARESDLFKSDSLVNDVNAAVRMVKNKVEAEDRKRKELKIEENGKAEKKFKEEATAVPPPSAEKDDMTNKKPKEERERVNEVQQNNGPQAPNQANGLDMDKYSWGQSLQEVNITVPVPPGTKSRFIACEIKKNHLKVGIKGQTPVIDGDLFQSVKVDDCFWSLEDQKSISILLTKQNQMEWWKYLVKGEPEIDTQKAEPENSKLSDLDPETRSTVEKMMHPEMDFSRAKIN
ncbi:protein BOBBER 2-like isoform X2 [Salvia miltiorrhiza]|uniref:protein BOBBER 2-like isoform X2 n=1 Tax=Salvia miltiorrhiza TaxID=226208 RepID=UPI0025ABAD8A|nr:protein BOBBER 2-like isoform X2 [Salvia miltiorrhiza]